MKLRYPAEAFALGIVLFSAGMKEAFAAGILVIFTSVFAELLKNLLEKAVPTWSLKLCVYIASGSVCASAFLAGFAVLGTVLTTELWIMVFIVGLLCGKHALSGNTDGEYGELLLESAFVWGLWILFTVFREFLGMVFIVGLLCGKHALSGNTDGEYGELLLESAFVWGLWILFTVFREFLGSGSIFGNTVFTAAFQSKAFLNTTFAFMEAGLVLASVNGILKKDCKGMNSLFPVVPAMFLFHPFTVESFAGIPGTIWVIAVPLLLFLSVKQTLKFARTGKFFRALQGFREPYG